MSQGPKPNYIILTSNYEDDLERMVNEKIDQGYEPRGGVGIAVSISELNGDKVFHYCVGMRLYDPERGSK